MREFGTDAIEKVLKTPSVRNRIENGSIVNDGHLICTFELTTHLFFTIIIATVIVQVETIFDQSDMHGQVFFAVVEKNSFLFARTTGTRSRMELVIRGAVEPIACFVVRETRKRNVEGIKHMGDIMELGVFSQRLRDGMVILHEDIRGFGIREEMIQFIDNEDHTEQNHQRSDQTEWTEIHHSSLWTTKANTRKRTNPSLSPCHSTPAVEQSLTFISTADIATRCDIIRTEENR